MTKLIKRLGLGWPLLATLALGCAYEVGDADDPGTEEIGQTQQAFNGLWHYHNTSTINQNFDIGSNTNRACFLTGVSGSLRGSSQQWHGAVIYEGTSNYTLRLSQHGGKIHADVACVTTWAGRLKSKTWNNGDAPTKLGAVTSNRRCFLSGVQARADAFANLADTVRVWSDGANWWLGGDVPHDVIASAMCVDIATDYGTWHYTATGSGVVHEPLALSSNPVFKACGLRHLQGKFPTGSDITKGVRATINSGLGQWFLDIKGDKSGVVNCVW
jgi:hypothetical protein